MTYGISYLPFYQLEIKLHRTFQAYGVRRSSYAENEIHMNLVLSQEKYLTERCHLALTFLLACQPERMKRNQVLEISTRLVPFRAAIRRSYFVQTSAHSAVVMCSHVIKRLTPEYTWQRCFLLH